MAGYNYTKFNTEDYDFKQFRGPALGHKIPNVTAKTLDGKPQLIADFSGTYLVLEMGSMTCPLYQGRRKIMEPLQQLHPDVTHAVLYVREAHPGDIVSAHLTADDKRACAQRLQSQWGESRQIWVDDLDGTVHQALGGFPNAVFIFNGNGCLVYRSVWNNPRATARALTDLKRGKVPRQEGIFLPPVPAVSIAVLRAGGKGAALDFFRGLPKLIWENLIKRNLRHMFGKRVAVDPRVEC